MENENVKLNDFAELFSSVVDAQLGVKLQEMGIDVATLPAKEPVPKQATLIKKRDRAVDNIKRIWLNNGTDPKTGLFVDFDSMRRIVWEEENGMQREWQGAAKDAQSSPDIMLVLPRVINEIVMEPLQFREPLVDLLRKVRVKGGNINITYPAIGAMGGQRLDMGETSEYPILQTDMSGFTNVKIGKSGVAVEVTEEVRRYSQYDILAMLIRGAYRALERWKAKKIADHILGLGVVGFNNTGGTPTTGRGSAGQLNGSFSIDDLYAMYASGINKGFNLDTLLMHPMAWLIFARDPNMRHLANLKGGPFFKSAQGQLPYAKAFENQGMALGPTLGLGGTASIAGMYTPAYNQFPVPLNIVVSPSMPFSIDGDGNPQTDIVMCDANELGVVFVDEDPTSDRWEDPARDILKIKIRERYAVGILNSGQAIRIARNVKILKNYDFDDRLSWTSGSGELPSA